jgi:hypothetical protein
VSLLERKWERVLRLVETLMETLMELELCRHLLS